jgi:hypothetical protein
MKLEIREINYCKAKFTVTVITMGTGTPFKSVGSYFHCLTAAIAA